METRFLETFLMVVELGSIAEASRKLNITSAAVAQRMRALEDQIGTPLVARVGQTVRPTEAGQAILGQTRSILHDVRRLRAAALADLPTGELRLGAVSTAMTGILPGALKRMRAVHDGIDIHIRPAKSGELYAMVERDELDAALIVHPPFPMAKTLNWSLLHAERLVLLCPDEWRDQDPHHLLRTQPFIRHDRANWGGQLAERYLTKAGIEVREWMELSSLEAITLMVNAGLGVSIVPRWPPPWPAGVSVALVPLPMPFEPRHLGLLWSRAAPSQRLIGVLRGYLEEIAAELPDPEDTLRR